MPPVRETVEPTLLITSQPGQHVLPRHADIFDLVEHAPLGRAEHQCFESCAERVERSAVRVVRQFLDKLTLFRAVIGTSAEGPTNDPRLALESDLGADAAGGETSANGTSVFGIGEG